MILMLDNYDSFTFNIVQYLGELGQDLVVRRNDEINISDIAAMAPDAIVISPGPCTPNEAGIALSLVQHFAGKLPILGVCLGCQTIGQACGANIVKAKRVMHGKTSEIFHQGDDLFKGLPSPFTATRYHSLVIDRDSLPACFEVTAWTRNAAGDRDDIMAITHREHKSQLQGVQFHPESILTEHGHDLLENFLRQLTPARQPGG